MQQQPSQKIFQVSNKSTAEALTEYEVQYRIQGLFGGGCFFFITWRCVAFWALPEPSGDLFGRFLSHDWGCVLVCSANLVKWSALGIDPGWAIIVTGRTPPHVCNPKPHPVTLTGRGFESFWSYFLDLLWSHFGLVVESCGTCSGVMSDLFRTCFEVMLYLLQSHEALNK